MNVWSCTSAPPYAFIDNFSFFFYLQDAKRDDDTVSRVAAWRRDVCDRPEPVFLSWEPASLSLCRLDHAHNVLYLIGDGFSD